MTEPVATKLRAAWPPELKRVEVLTFLGSDAHFDPLLSELDEILGATSPDLRRSRYLILIGAPPNEMVARLVVRKAGGGARFALVCTETEQAESLTSVEHSDETLRRIWDAVDRNNDTPEQNLYAIADSEFAMDHWRPAAPLPSPMPSFVPDKAGVPLLTGFDLEFSDSKQPLSRLSLAVYPNLGQIVGSISFFINRDNRLRLPEVILETAAAYKGMLVRSAEESVK
jgi:hypothetical protein